MTQEEIIEILQAMRNAGMKFEICDTPVPYYPEGVSAGIPKETLDQCAKEYIMIPRSILGNRLFIFTEVNGDSMVDAHIYHKDIVRVEITDHFHEKDIVVSFLDNQSVLKVYHEDERGDVWLLPRNKDYKPIRVRDYDDIRIIGKVTKVESNPPVITDYEIRDAMNKVEEVQQAEIIPTDDIVRDTIEFVIPELQKTSRLWFSVYRSLVDKRYLSRNSLNEFITTMRRLFPDRLLNINTKDLGRLETGCFRKPIRFWNEYDAPVKGKPFERYYGLATRMLDML